MRASGTSAAPQPQSIYLLDQMVNVVEYADISSKLSGNGFIATFNIPYFNSTFNASGYGPRGFNYAADPRHRIFARDYVNVASKAQLYALMSQNNYPSDPLSPDPCTAISARCDLLKPADAYAFGGIDAKTADNGAITASLLACI